MVLSVDMQSRWRGFLEEVYHEQMTDLAHLWPKKQSIEVRYGDLQAYDPDFAADILQKPRSSFEGARTVLKILMQELGTDADAQLRLIELPTDHRMALRDVRNENIGPLLAIDGIVSKITSVRPMVTHATFRCLCGHDTTIEQLDQSKMEYPLECKEYEGGCGLEERKTRFKIVHEESVHLDTQEVVIQELPEKVKSGQAAEMMTCYLQGDLAGVLAPGNRVTMNGRLFRRAQRRGGRETPIFDLFYQGHSYERNNIPLDAFQHTSEEKEEIILLSKREDLDELLVNSIAPSIYGLTGIKRSLVLQLFGGVSRVNSDSTRTRGDIHVLLMGDPGVAKSQLLNYMSGLSPLGQFASGMSSSGAGLTAAAVQHPDGGWTVEAGALPLADLGMASIDEFDKMGEQDRSSMHEAMEQQRISIHKATVHTTMRTRCAILAAANPQNGRFIDPEIHPKGLSYTSQIKLPPPLLSRFDCIWLMRDQPVREDDRRIGAHIAGYRQSGTPEWLIDEGIRDAPTSSDAAKGTIDGKEIIEPDALKKYVSYAKMYIHPTLNDKAKEKILDYYENTRIQGGGRFDAGSEYSTGDRSGQEIGRDSLDSIPITARSIEALIRLAEARARSRLSNEVTEEDANYALMIFDMWRYELLGSNFDETTITSGRATTKRNKEQLITSFVVREYQKTDQPIEIHTILNGMEEHRMGKNQVEDILDDLCNNGTLFRPSGRDSYQPV